MKSSKSKKNVDKKLLKIILVLVSALVVIGFCVVYFINYLMLTVSLNGSSEITIPVFGKYVEAGVSVKKGKRIVKEYDKRIDCDVDTNVVGNYSCSYYIKAMRREYNFHRSIVVADMEKPVINTELTNLTKEYCSGKFKEEIVYSAFDNYDGDLTDKVSINETDSEYILSVSDSSNNSEILSIPITKEPKPSSYLSLYGSKSMNIYIGNVYNESGAGAYDGCGKKLNNEVIIEGNVDTNTLGQYSIKYTTIIGNKTYTAYRTINVINPDGVGKVVYLTFDDGPGGYTESILNTLDKYGVKATFFVTNQFPSKQYLIGEEARRGHTVGIHTYSHKWNIYDSVEAYMNDFNAISDIVVNETGIKPYIFRFPGGSSNTVSKSHCLGIISTLANQLVSEGYAYFDWNVSSGDAEGASTSKIVSNVKSGMKNHNTSVVLMHDIKKNTASALDEILSYGVNNGYTFKTLTTSSYGAHHNIAN